jgi:hypothetical protein
MFEICLRTVQQEKKTTQETNKKKPWELEWREGMMKNYGTLSNHDMIKNKSY